MRIVESYSHLNGHEWLTVHQPNLISEITKILADVDADKLRTKISKEKTKAGKQLYNPVAINDALGVGFESHGWNKNVVVRYWVTSDYEILQRTMELEPPEQKDEIESAGLPAISSYNQTDFTKNGAAVEVQFGKYAFIGYDLFVKHLAFYVSGKIKVGVEIIPMKSMQAEMSSGPGYYEKALYDLARSGRGVPPVPLWVVGVGA